VNQDLGHPVLMSILQWSFLSPLKAFFLLWNWTMTITRPDVCKNINDLQLFKRDFYDVFGWVGTMIIKQYSILTRRSCVQTLNIGTFTSSKGLLKLRKEMLNLDSETLILV